MRLACTKLFHMFLFAVDKYANRLLVFIVYPKIAMWGYFLIYSHISGCFNLQPLF